MSAAFNPWTATDAEVVEASGDADDQGLWLVMQVEAARAVVGMRSAIERGDGGAVMDAMALCAQHGLVAPAWLAAVFVARVKAVRAHKLHGWSDAFGAAHAKGAHLSRLRKDRAAGPVIAHMVGKLRREGWRVDEALFEEVARRLHGAKGLGATEVKRIFYSTRPSISAKSRKFAAIHRRP